MKRLLQIRTNIYYTKKPKKTDSEPDIFDKHHELVILLDQASYSYSNSQEVVRERQVEEIRFCIADENFDKFIDILTKLKEVKEEDLH